MITVLTGIMNIRTGPLRLPVQRSHNLQAYEREQERSTRRKKRVHDIILCESTDRSLTEAQRLANRLSADGAPFGDENRRGDERAVARTNEVLQVDSGRSSTSSCTISCLLIRRIGPCHGALAYARASEIQRAGAEPPISLLDWRTLMQHQTRRPKRTWVHLGMVDLTQFGMQK